MDIPDHKLEEMLERATKAGYTKCAADLGLVRPYISKRTAYKMYSRRTVENAIIADRTLLTEYGIDRVRLGLKLSLKNSN